MVDLRYPTLLPRLAAIRDKLDHGYPKAYRIHYYSLPGGALDEVPGGWESGYASLSRAAGRRVRSTPLQG